MVQSAATSVSDYLKELDPDRRKIIKSVRRSVKEHLQKGFKEMMDFGMITYVVPLSRYPQTYNKKPLMYAALASQKNYCSLYLMNIYAGSSYLRQLEQGFQKSGKKLDVGKCCLRFKAIDDLDVKTLGTVIAGCSVEDWIANYEKCRARSS